MITQLEKTNTSPLAEGIKVIGIGRHGSKNLSDTLIQSILSHLETQMSSPIQEGAFFGALITKGVTSQEMAFEKYLGTGAIGDHERLLRRVCPDMPQTMQSIALTLLSGQSLTIEEARQLGDFMFSDQPGESLRGMVASILRIRYETDEEYQGFMQAVEATFTEGFRATYLYEHPVVQLAEPFDGVEHSYMITPVLAYALGQQGYKVVSTTGKTSGPKYAMNLLEVYIALGGHFVKNANELLQAAPKLGWVLDQHDVSPAVYAWVARRRAIIKRPFLATLEKVLNPTGAAILITSVFHLTYMEKMVDLAKMAGFRGVIVLKRGLEGTLAPSIARASGILCAAQQADGSFVTTRIEADSEAFLSFRGDGDDVVEGVTAEQNAHLIQQFVHVGSTGNRDFDQRANLAIALYTQGLQWIKSVWNTDVG